MSETMVPTQLITGLGARVHLFVRPEYRQAFTSVFRDVLGCDVAERDFGLPHPILLVAFDDGSRFSVEFSDSAPKDPEASFPDEAGSWGAWIEFRSPDVPECERRLRQAGVQEFTHRGSRHHYFRAPGGQVFRLLDLAYDGP